MVRPLAFGHVILFLFFFSFHRSDIRLMSRFLFELISVNCKYRPIMTIKWNSNSHALNMSNVNCNCGDGVFRHFTVRQQHVAPCMNANTACRAFLYISNSCRRRANRFVSFHSIQYSQSSNGLACVCVGRSACNKMKINCKLN